MPVPKISEAEWEVMQVLWAKNPLPSTDVVAALRQSGWSPTTIRTLLSRLVEKKALGCVKQNGLLIYRPLIDQETAVGRATSSFIDRILGGSIQPLMAHFVEKQKMTPEELAALKRLIREREKHL